MHSKSQPAADAAFPMTARTRTLQWLAALALACLPALVVNTPWNLLPFGLLLLATSVLGIDRLWQARAVGQPALGTVAGLAALVMLSAIASMGWFGQDLREFDNHSRFVVIPWAMLWTCALRPRASALWVGALLGLFGALLVAVVQVAGGAWRAEAWTNAIVLADIVLMLMVLLVFCRPHGQWRWVATGLVAGCAVIVLTGSRGVWLGLLALLVAIGLGSRWRDGRTRLLTLAGLLAVAATLVLMVPGLSERLRLDELRQDVERLERGDTNSSAGARVERLWVAWDTFREHPLTGVGIDRFDEAMKRLPECALEQQSAPRCHLSHAHNDLAEWAATRGVPGVLLLLAIYGVPLLLFARLHRRSGHGKFRGPAAAGIMVVVGYALCGLTQSMFAHQITASFYVSIVGVLMGLAVLRARTVAAQPRG